MKMYIEMIKQGIENKTAQLWETQKIGNYYGNLVIVKLKIVKSEYRYFWYIDNVEAISVEEIQEDMFNILQRYGNFIEKKEFSIN